MRRWLIRISPALQLTRISSAFAAVANVWFVILWTRAIPEEAMVAPSPLRDEPLWLLLLGGAANALGLFAFATALNDVVDYRRDHALSPDRPIPAGRLTLDQAVTLTACTFGLAVLGATPMGMPSVMLTLLLCAAILFFNIGGRYVPAVGLVVLGLIYAGQMVVPNLSLRFVWPVWLVMTHALAVAALTHVVGKKVPGVSPRAAVVAITGWLFWSIVIFTFGYFRGGAARPADNPPDWQVREFWPDYVPQFAWVGPVVLAAAFAILAWMRVRSIGMGRRAAEKLARYGALWLALYACVWMIGVKLWTEAAILGVLTLAGFLGMTILREVFAMLEHPVGYRR